MKLWLKIVIGLVAFVIIAFLSISAYMGYSMTRVEREAITESPADYNLAYEDIEFPSREDSLTIRGWYLPAESDTVIIMVHGAESNRADTSVGMLEIAAELVNHDYSILMFDMRAHGESDGERISIGYHERKDVLGAVDYAEERGFQRIGILGFSMGGATSLLAAAEDDTIDCLVSDSAYADMAGIIKREFKERSSFPTFFLDPMLFMIKIMYGVDFKAVKPYEAVPEIAPRPILFIHGGEDDFVPIDHAYRLYEASENPADTLWIVPGADHVRAYRTAPEEYIHRVTAFFDEYLR
jgi:dipeptidyl aminopeptidase/acylaminoacyl peptidase